MSMFVQKKKNETQVRQKTAESEKALRKLAEKPLEELYEALGTNAKGLGAGAAAERLEETGPNAITGGRQKGAVRRLVESFVNPFNLVLLLVAAITFVTDVVLSNADDYTTVIIILVLVAISGLISFVQGERSQSAARELSKMISNKADVLRDGEAVEVDIEEIVPGDVVRLSAGDIIPGDVRFLYAKDAFVAQAALTGESNPVEKFATEAGSTAEALTDLANLGFMGSNMVSGSALALVLATGDRTYFGAMAQSMTGDRAKNSFERGIDSVSALLIRFMLVMVPVIFVINGVFKGDWGSSLLFAVTIAVGLTPEMLPVIMTSTLARGAVAMSKHQTIVKTLSAIQTFGEMDILCTDKTGTITEDKIILEKYMDIHGNDDTRVLRHAYLNSYFQTGLKNLIDLAVMNRAAENGLEPLLEAYTLVDEIPFDFSRRRMSVVLLDRSGKRQLITKGAVEEVTAICSFVEYDGQVQPLDDALREEAMAVYRRHNDDGLRVVAVAQKNDIREAGAFGVEDERDMVLIGFVGFLDPPKESAKAAITALGDHGVRVVVLTGDSEGVAVKVCGKVGVDVAHCLTGADVEKMDDIQIQTAVRSCNLFSKLSPSQKQRLVEAMQENGHTVGYMGDGINDAPALRQADVGISVDSAVDIAKETADIILLKKDLMVLEEGVIEGRKTFGNLMKYIKMAASGNFGNMISVLVASIFLPFLPMLPVHILTQNLLCDFSQIGIPFDHVDQEYVRTPRRWETGGIQRFMFAMGPLSSLFDLACFGVLYWIMGAGTTAAAPLFQSGWFLFGTLSQILVVFMIRTAKIPFVQSRPSAPLMLSTAIVSVLAILIGFTGFATALDMAVLPTAFAPWLLALLAAYCICTQLFKVVYIRLFKEWI